MKILMLFVILTNAVFYLYLLFKQIKKYQELELEKVRSKKDKNKVESSENSEIKKINVEEVLRKNVIGVLIVTFVMVVSTVNKEPFKFKNFSNLTIILMIFNTLYFDYINRQLKKIDEFDEKLKRRILMIGSYVLPVITMLLIILQKLFVK